MSQRISNLFILGFVMFFVVGCGWIQTVQDLGASNSNANIQDKTREALGLKKTGIAECDEVVDILAQKAKGNTGEEESWTNRAMTELVKQQIYNYVNEGGANKTPKEKADMTQQCKTALGFLKEEPKK